MDVYTFIIRDMVTEEKLGTVDMEVNDTHGIALGLDEAAHIARDMWEDKHRNAVCYAAPDEARINLRSRA